MKPQQARLIVLLAQLERLVRRKVSQTRPKCQIALQVIIASPVRIHVTLMGVQEVLVLAQQATTASLAHLWQSLVPRVHGRIKRRQLTMNSACLARQATSALAQAIPNPLPSAPQATTATATKTLYRT